MLLAWRGRRISGGRQWGRGRRGRPLEGAGWQPGDTPDQGLGIEREVERTGDVLRHLDRGRRRIRSGPASCPATRSRRPEQVHPGEVDDRVVVAGVRSATAKASSEMTGHAETFTGPHRRHGGLVTAIGQKVEQEQRARLRRRDRTDTVGDHRPGRAEVQRISSENPNVAKLSRVSVNGGSSTSTPAAESVGLGSGADARSVAPTLCVSRSFSGTVCGRSIGAHRVARHRDRVEIDHGRRRERRRGCRGAGREGERRDSGPIQCSSSERHGDVLHHRTRRHSVVGEWDLRAHVTADRPVLHRDLEEGVPGIRRARHAESEPHLADRGEIDLNRRAPVLARVSEDREIDGLARLERAPSGWRRP